MLESFNYIFNFLNSAEFPKIAYQCLSILEVPIHILVSYLILFKTPKRMGSVKWTLFNVQFWSALLDLTLSSLVVPYLLFPVAAGYSFGVFEWLRINPAIQTIVVIIQIGMTIISILVLFENRYTFLTGSSQFWSRARKTFIGFLYVVALTYFIPFTFLIPDQSIAGQAVVQRLPTLRSFYSGPIFVFSQDATLLMWITIIKLIVEFSSIYTLVVLTYFKISSQKRTTFISPATMNLQKKFFITIIIQTVIPGTILMLPLSYCGYSLANQYYNQALNNIAFLIMTSHGIVSTIAMLFLHKPYRDATFKCIKINKSKYKNSITAARNAME